MLFFKFNKLLSPMKQKIVVVHSTVCLKSNGGHVTEGSLKPLRNLTKWALKIFFIIPLLKSE